MATALEPGLWMTIFALYATAAGRFEHHPPDVNAHGAKAPDTTRRAITHVVPALGLAGRSGGQRMFDSAAAQAIANHWLQLNSSTAHAGDPAQDGDVWRLPIHVDFPVPQSTDPLSFRNLGEIVINSTNGEVVGYPTTKVREARMVDELGRVLGEIHKGIPDFDCGRCGGCCGVLGATWMEMQIIDIHVKKQHIEVPEYLQTKTPNTTILRTTDKLLCPYLKDHTCMVYSVRPTICRLFGTVTAHMVCATGRAATGDLTSKEAYAILRRVSVLDLLYAAICRRKAAVE